MGNLPSKVKEYVMKFFIAVEKNTAGETIIFSDDVVMVTFTASSVKDWPKVVEHFNALKLPTSHFNLSIDIKDNWVLTELGEAPNHNDITIIEHIVAHA